MENKYKIIDTHTHYAHKRFSDGRHEILSSLPDANICAVIDGAIDFESNEKMLALSKKYPHLYVAVGCHPNCVDQMSELRFEMIREWTEQEKVVAIGETGLDYAGEKSKEQILLQKKWFRRFVDLAIQVHKPLVIHCREAYDDLMDILTDYDLPKHPGVIHCFSGDYEQAKQLVEMGFYLGIGGKFTRTDAEMNELRQTVQRIAAENIVLETDAPYLLPEGLAGKRNTSLSLPYIVNQLSELWGVEEEAICRFAWQNTLMVFPDIKV